MEWFIKTKKKQLNAFIGIKDNFLLNLCYNIFFSNIKMERAINYIDKNKKKCNVGVFGSRSLCDERVKILILEKIDQFQATKIITCQEPEGVSEVSQKIAKEYGFPLQLHFLNFIYRRGAFERRSIEIIKESDCFIVIHDGESKGTANELKLVKKSKKPFSYDILDKTPFKRSVGFNIENEWDITEDKIDF